MIDSPSPTELPSYSQVTIKLQGTRNSSRQAMLDLLPEIALQLAEGHASGRLEADGCGYVFKTEMVLAGPSIFQSEAECVESNSLRATVAQKLGPHAVTRLDEMSPIHRAALERHFRFAVRDSKNLRFLKDSNEEAVLEQAFRLLTRRSQTEQRAIWNAIGLGDNLPET